MSRFSISILVVGFAVIASMIWYRIGIYEAGKALEPFHFGRTLIAQIILGIGVIALIGATPVAIYRAIRRKKYQPVAFIALTLALSFIASKLPFPTFFDGYAEGLQAIESTQFYEIAKILRETEKVDGDNESSPYLPDGLIASFPVLTEIFAYKQATNVRYNLDAESVTVFDGSGLAGHRGFRVYLDHEKDPYAGTSDYVGSFREVHPGVFTYVRFY